MTQKPENPLKKQRRSPAPNPSKKTMEALERISKLYGKALKSLASK